MSKFFPGHEGPNEDHEVPCAYGEEVGVPHSMFGRTDEDIEENIAAGEDLSDPETTHYCPTCIDIEQNLTYRAAQELAETGYSQDDIHKLLGIDDIIGRAKDRVFIDKGGKA